MPMLKSGREYAYTAPTPSRRTRRTAASDDAAVIDDGAETANEVDDSEFETDDGQRDEEGAGVDLGHGHEADEPESERRPRGVAQRETERAAEQELQAEQESIRATLGTEDAGRKSTAHSAERTKHWGSGQPDTQAAIPRI